MKEKTSRRAFLELSIKSGLALSLSTPFLMSCKPKSSEAVKEESKKLNILILGGTSFLGPHQIAYALDRGHSISTFTRGKTKPTIHTELFDRVEQLVGDRNDNLTALEGRKWDAVIDNSGRNVDWTDSSASLLKDNCGLYVYVSSVSVFYPYINSEFKEDSKVVDAIPEDATEEEKPNYDYGVMKYNSERIAAKHFGEDRTIVVRPTYMVGPADRTDRFMHWPLRLAQGGEVLVPGAELDMVQYADVRDIANWMIRLIENKSTGVFNAVGPANSQTVQAFVSEASRAFDVKSSFVKVVDYEFLEANNLFYSVPWIMPTGYFEGTSKINNEKAKASGLTFRPLQNTIKDTYDWWFSEAVTQERRDKYANNPRSLMNREKELLEKWKNENK